MDIKIFSDLLDAAGKVFSAIKAIANIPKAEKEKYRQTMSETYMLMDTTLNMIILRLGDIGLIGNDADFLVEAKKLDNYDQWIKVEREFRLCSSLRIAVRDTEMISKKLLGKMSAAEWDDLLNIMRSTLAAEGDVAYYISNKFHSLAAAAGKASPSTQEIKSIRDQVSEVRDIMKVERQRLIQLESDLLSFAI
jgi:hypothetical protein